MKASGLSQEEFKRYIRQIILSDLGIEGQEKLKRAKVLVIGAGGLGCPVLLYLSAAGIGTIGLVDYDLVDNTNLHRQILFSSDDIDKPKVIVAKEKLLALNPHVIYHTYFGKLTPKNVLDIVKDYDVVVEGSDNFATKFLVNDACVILDKPFVLGAVSEFEGQLSVFNYQGGPTYRCLSPEEPDPFESPSCAEIGVIGVIPGIIGCLQANETIKIITGLGQVLSGKYLLFNALTMDYNLIDINRDEEHAGIRELGKYHDFCTPDVDSVKQITAGDLKQLIRKDADIQIIDLREAGEADNLPISAESIPFSQIRKRHDAISKTKQVIVMCQWGIKSLSAIRYLENKHGFTNLYSLSNGVSEWQQFYGE